MAKVSVVDVKNAAFKLDTSGASRVTLAGVTDKLIIDVSGASKIDAESLTAVFRDPAHEVHPFIIGYFQDSQRMIREGDWKLIWYPKIDRLQLFDLKSDPHELHDLSGQPIQADRIAAMRTELTGWLREHSDRLVLAP